MGNRFKVNIVHTAFEWSFRLAAMGLGITLVTARPCPADTVTLAPSADNTLYEDVNGAISGGLGQNFFVGRTGPSGGSAARRGVIRFDVSSIPAGATVTSATLRLNMNQTGFGSPLQVNVHRLMQGWGEGTTTLVGPGGTGGVSTAESATWIHSYYNTSLWATVGGHFTNVESVGVFVQNPGSYDFSSASVAADVQSWIDTPSTNFGWLVKTALEGIGALRFDSRESSTPANRPQLIVGYLYTPPKPAFSRISRSGTTFSNTWSAITGQVYQMQYATNLTGAQAWTSLGTITASTTVASMSDTNALNYRAYRVVNVQF